MMWSSHKFRHMAQSLGRLWIFNNLVRVNHMYFFIFILVYLKLYFLLPPYLICPFFFLIASTNVLLLLLSLLFVCILFSQLELTHYFSLVRGMCTISGISKVTHSITIIVENLIQSSVWEPIMKCCILYFIL